MPRLLRKEKQGIEKDSDIERKTVEKESEILTKTQGIKNIQR
jgi:hypothetical protein